MKSEYMENIYKSNEIINGTCVYAWLKLSNLAAEIGSCEIS